MPASKSPDNSTAKPNRSSAAKSDRTSNSKARWKRDAMVAGGTGITVAIVIGAATFLMGNVGDTEARRLLDAIIPTSRAFCSAILTVSATILALMLTLLGIGSQTDAQLSDTHFHRVQKIGFYNFLLFAFTAVFFVLHCVPVIESDKIPGWWYTFIYYGLLVSTAVIAGAAVSVVSLLYMALRNLIQVVGLGVENHELIAESDDQS